jgi:hypothetical protein
MSRPSIATCVLGTLLGCAGGSGSSSSSSGTVAPSSSSSAAGSSSRADGSSSAPGSSATSAASSAGTASSGTGLPDGTAVLTGSAAFLATTTFAIGAGNPRTIHIEETAAATCQDPLPPSAIHRLRISMHPDGGSLLAQGNHVFGEGGPWGLSLETLQADGGYETTVAVGGTLALTENSSVRARGYVTAVKLMGANNVDGGVLTGAFNAPVCP